MSVIFDTLSTDFAHYLNIKTKNRFTMMIGSDEPLGVCHSVIT